MKQMLLAAIAATMSLAAGAATIRVVSQETDKTGIWSDACVGLPEALSRAAQGDTILVASGTYAITATLEPSVRYLTIQSANIATGEPDPAGTVLDGGGSVRIMNVKAKNVTVSGFTFANGYLNGGGGAALRLESSNASEYFCVSNCVFTGNRSTGDGTCIYSYITQHGSIFDCVFTNNTLTAVGGTACGCAIYTQMNAESADHRILVKGCDFRNNNLVAARFLGGVVRALRGIILDDCTFDANTFTVEGSASSASEGGVVQVGGYSVVRNCTFSGETPDQNSIYGTYFEIGGPHVVVSNSTFTAINEHVAGYGVILVNGDYAEFHGCSFTNCAAKAHLIYILNKSGHLFRNCLFAGNRHPSGSVITRNNCAGYTVENCTFVDNEATRNVLSGGGSATNLLVNSIFTGAIEAPSSKLLYVASNCCLAARLDGEYDSGNFVSADPGFRRRASGDYHLRSTSPCVDAGLAQDWMSAGSLDCAGRARVAGNGVDIGCYECQPGELDSTLLVVADEADRTGQWANATTNFQGVIDGAVDGDLILVRSGLYGLTSEIVISNKTVHVRSCNPETLETDREGTVFVGTNCPGRALVVSTGPMTTANVSYGLTPVTSHPIVVEGFTFRNFSVEGTGGAIWFGGQGSMNGSPAMITNCAFYSNTSSSHGGAIRIFHGGVIAGCLFEGNSAGKKGGAVFCESTSSYSYNVQPWSTIVPSRYWYYPSIVGCTFLTNSAAENGGAINSVQNIRVVGCRMERNTAGSSQTGAGLNTSIGAARVESCVFVGNAFDGVNHPGYGSACHVGGGSLISNCVATAGVGSYGTFYNAGHKDLLIVDCVATNNSSQGFWVNGGTIRQCLSAGNGSHGIGQFQSCSTPLVVENCTLVRNAARGIGIMNESFTNANFVCNSIIWGNSQGVCSIANDDGSQQSVISNSFVDGDAPAREHVQFVGTWKTSNVKFVDAAAGDYHLAERSPAREKSTVLPWMTSGATDLDGNPRRVSLKGLPVWQDADALPDLGCYECQLYGVPNGTTLILR